MLTTFPFVSAPPYRCLSYVWGEDVPQDQHIIVNDIQVKVRKNLLGFLRRLRAGSSDPDGYLWIDAICINQADLSERAEQVQMMGYVYRLATGVIAWLGYEYDRMGDASDDGEERRDVALEDDAGTAVAFARELASRLRAWIGAGGRPWGGELSRHAFDSMEVYELLALKPVPMRTWRALAALLDRAWFKRAWIVQEAALAKDMVLVLGFEVISWDDLIHVAIFLQASGWHLMLLRFVRPTGLSLPFGYLPLLFSSLRSCCRLQQVPSILGKVVKLPTETIRPFPPADITDGQVQDFFARLVILSRPLGASDPRDKVFAALALTNVALARYKPRLPSPYYASSPQETYTNITMSFLRYCSDLYVLSQVEDRSARCLSGLPSWVPDYSQSSHCPFTDIPGLSYKALGDRPKQCTVDKRNGKVTLEGCFFDTLDDFPGPPGSNLDDMFMGRDFQPLIKFCLDHMPMTQDSQDRTEVLWRTLIGDCDGTNCPAAAETAACFKRNIQLIAAISRYGDRQKTGIVADEDWSAWNVFDDLHSSSTAAKEVIPSVRELRDFAEEWRQIMSGSRADLPRAKTVAGPSDIFALAAGRVYGRRKMFLSRKRVLGLAPASARKSDEIWFLSGAKVPFVLRPRQEESGRQTFSLIGEAYVNGYMFGKILTEDPIFREVVLS